MHFRTTSIYTNVSLARQGCIGTSPLIPSIAITIRTLETYRQTHNVCPRLSIHAEVKKLCRVHHIPYHRHLAEQFRTAFDVYLEVLRRIDTRINAALKHDTPHWRMLNSCPACQYQVVDEPPLRFSFLAAMDGNNSLKLVDPLLRWGNERRDPRCGQGSLWLTEDYVDVFKDEVRSQMPMPPSKNNSTGPSIPIPTNSSTSAALTFNSDDQPLDDQDPEWTDIAEDGSSTEPTDVCIERWKNASPESRKKMFAIFRKSGIFVTVCRHGFLLTICDMVRSGELMKYPLACVKKMLDVYGNKFCFGYDIKCRFWKILLRSSLGSKVRELGVEGVVPAFHGHAHNRYCQLCHHSKHMLGAGKEDFETCERTFSESNALAGETRFASEFHRHQAIDSHFQFADEEKYASLSKFIQDNYTQALSSITVNEAMLNTLHQVSGVTPQDFEDDLRDKKVYLQQVHERTDDDSIEIDYAKALNEYEEAKYNLDHQIIYGGIKGSKITDIGRRCTRAFNKVELKLQQVEDLEQQAGIEQRWTVTHPERIKAQSRITHRQFHKAVDDVERLVVMRLLEMTKLQMSGLGYKLRTQISKALKTRATTIRNALARYNKYASALDPPRPPLSWEKIVEYSFLGEFTLLRETDAQVHTRSWAKPQRRQDAAKYFDLLHSREEIGRCNVEIHRLLTKIRDDELDYPAAIAELEALSPPLATELKRRWEYLRGINAIHIARIQHIQSLPGYTGPTRPDRLPTGSASLDQDRVVENEVELGELLANTHI
ncbi:hypothetical protein BJ138DRAFT_1135257 [Hygrophoropsis aurantiaca]|uniref:Uncharacterized protein n=1 Tax=Hygrophoropsis aurantiaca TaxID=72124 RepID=A0ACB8ADZ4_9AGAM|nr:hypothetical protein BJ138DRAFT_1135257 [Hygrophoropsis aurantiaca]